MCRLFAKIAPRPESAAKLLAESRFSLLAQADFERENLQKDGWGVATYDARCRPRVVKSAGAAYEEKEAFIAASRPASQVVIGHIRAASNPRGLPKSQLIDPDNAQPFTDGRWVFAHNGTLEIPDAVAEKLGPLARNLKSKNDSEVYFWQFLKHFEKLKDVPAALQACVDEDWASWEEVKEKYPEKKSPYTSLNALISDGASLHAFCHANRKGLADCAVCTPGQPWSRMSFAHRGEALVVASEPVDAGAWELFQAPEVLSARIEGRALTVERRKIAAPQVSFEEAVSP